VIGDGGRFWKCLGRYDGNAITYGSRMGSGRLGVTDKMTNQEQRLPHSQAGVVHVTRRGEIKAGSEDFNWLAAHPCTWVKREIRSPPDTGKKPHFLTICCRPSQSLHFFSRTRSPHLSMPWEFLDVRNVSFDRLTRPLQILSPTDFGR
jgi:hypothetical protein